MRYFWIFAIFCSLQFNIIGILVLPLMFLRSLMNKKSRIVHCWCPTLKGAKNLSYPSKREEDPAHIKTTATISLFFLPLFSSSKVFPYVASTYFSCYEIWASFVILGGNTTLGLRGPSLDRNLLRTKWK